jgi:phage baseplate assembly protein W
MAEREAPAVRYAVVQFGDDIRRIALREMGDASVWVDLVILNGLRPPYIAEEADAGVLAFGDQIMVPAPGSVAPVDVDADALFGSDLKVGAKRLEVENGDFVLVSGIANLNQALRHHVIVDKGELAFHPEFGSLVRSLIGTGNGPTSGQLAALYVKSALLEDPRVDTIESCIAQVAGDQISVSAVAVPVTGPVVELQVVV